MLNLSGFVLGFIFLERVFYLVLAPSSPCGTMLLMLAFKLWRRSGAACPRSSSTQMSPACPLRLIHSEWWDHQWLLPCVSPVGCFAYSFLVILSLGVSA
jgi:hypothetical protein